ncbi:MAG: hypothetical protein IKS68_08510, partial [Mailhella sp.]|nr:hypothetical protein [Mailhella sp.]
MNQKKLLQVLQWGVIVLMALLAFWLVFLAATNGAGAQWNWRSFFYENALRFILLLALSDALVLILLRRRKLLNEEALAKERERQSLEDLVSKKISEQYFNIYCVDMDEDRVIYTASSEIAVRHYGKGIMTGQEKYSRIAALY